MAFNVVSFVTVCIHTCNAKRPSHACRLLAHGECLGSRMCMSAERLWLVPTYAWVCANVLLRARLSVHVCMRMHAYVVRYACLLACWLPCLLDWLFSPSCDNVKAFSLGSREVHNVYLSNLVARPRFTNIDLGFENHLHSPFGGHRPKWAPLPLQRNQV